MKRQLLYQVNLDDYDRRIVINALNLLRNEQIKADRDTSSINDLIIRFCEAKSKNGKKVLNESR